MRGREQKPQKHIREAAHRPEIWPQRLINAKWGPLFDREERKVSSWCKCSKEQVNWWWCFVYSYNIRKEFMGWSDQEINISAALSRIGYLTHIYMYQFALTPTHNCVSHVLYIRSGFFDWDETQPIWYVGHYLAYCTSPWWQTMMTVGSSRWNENWQGKQKYSEKTCPSATLSTTNPTLSGLERGPSRWEAWAMAQALIIHYIQNL
jgi:hypothetical protein